MSKEKKLAKAAARAELAARPKRKVKMRFAQDKFYNDLSKPLYEKGQVYEVEGEDMINRWIKRGGEIIGEYEAPVPVPEVPVEPTEPKVEEPVETKPEEPVEDVDEKDEDESKSVSKGKNGKNK